MYRTEPAWTDLLYFAHHVRYSYLVFVHTKGLGLDYQNLGLKASERR